MSGEELWRPSLIDSRWEISSHGRVRGGILNPTDFKKLCSQGYYLQVRITGSYRKIHRLVAQCFVKNLRPDILKHIDHIDGNKTNNHWLNLRWVNAKLNMRNCQVKGCHKRGKKYLVKTCYDDKQKYHGRYETEQEAISVYKKLQTEAFASLYILLTGDPSLGLGHEKFLKEKDFQILGESKMSRA
jgi:hypothetical protein